MIVESEPLDGFGFDRSILYSIRSLDNFNRYAYQSLLYSREIISLNLNLKYPIHRGIYESGSECLLYSLEPLEPVIYL